MSPFVSKLSALCMLAVFVMVIPALAQNSGSIQGTVLDPQGAVIPNAVAQAVDQAKGVVVRETTTGNDGLFQLQPLQPGTYSIRIRATGMKELVRKDVVLDSRQVLGLGELRTTLGAANETMTVEAMAAPVVEIATSDHSSVIDSKQVTETSLNGRDFQSLISTLPGVVTNQGDSSFRMAFNNTDGSTSTDCAAA